MASKEFSNLLVGGGRKSKTAENGTGAVEEAVAKSASLLDDTLSDKKRKTNWKTPIWISILVMAASLLALYFSGSEPADASRLAEQAEASRNPELLEKLVNEAKTAEENGPTSGLQAEPLRQMNPAGNTNPAGIKPSSRTTTARKDNPPQAPPAREPSPETKSAAVPAGQTAAIPASPADTGQEDTSTEQMPQLIRDVRNEEPAADEPVSTPPSAALNPHQESFDYLGSSNAVAGKLINGGYSNLNYSGWKVIRETNQEVWIDIEASWSSGGPAIHHIWSVDLANRKTKALSQAARNLEALDK